MSARLFAALELPAEVRGALGAFGRAAADGDFALRAVSDDALHVTLAFLGHRPLDDIDPAAEAVRSAVEGSVAALSLGDPLWLAPRRPRWSPSPLPCSRASSPPRGVCAPRKVARARAAC